MKIEAILKESSMTKEYFNEVKWILLEMKASGKTKIFSSTPLAMARPSEGIIVEEYISKIHFVPYVIVA